MAKKAESQTDDSINPLDQSSEAPVLKEVHGTAGFVYMKEVHNILTVAMHTEENVILYGPGGYGKSEYTTAFLAEEGIDPYIITMGSGMTTDRLFGGTDLEKFDKTGKIEFLVENSFMNHEYVIFEELFDAPDFILEQLKDILSSKIFRNGNQIFRIKTRVIFCCTNRTRSEFAKDASLKALMERFPLEKEVKWKSFGDINYKELLETKFGHADPFLCYLFSQYSANNVQISPRIAVKTAKIVNATNYDSLMFIAEFAQNPTLLRNTKKSFESKIKLNEYGKEFQKIVKQVDEYIKQEDLEAATKAVGEIKNIHEELKKIKMSDDMIKDVENFKSEIGKKCDSLLRSVELLKQAQL